MRIQLETNNSFCNFLLHLLASLLLLLHCIYTLKTQFITLFRESMPVQICEQPIWQITSFQSLSMNLSTQRWKKKEMGRKCCTTHCPMKKSNHLGILLGRSSLLLLANIKTIMLAVPLAEGRSIHLNNSILHQCLGSDKLIVRWVVDNIQYPDFSCDCLRSPREVASIQSEGPELQVATPHANASHSFVTGKLGHSRLPSKLIPITTHHIIQRTLRYNKKEGLSIQG